MTVWKKKLVTERTVLYCTDNMAGFWWKRKGPATCTSNPAHLLRLQAMHQRFHCYVSCIDFFSRVENLVSDRPSRSLDLTDNQLLAYLNTNFSQPLSWRLWTPLPRLVSGIASALRQKTSERGCLLAEPPPLIAIVPNGPTSAQGWPWTPYLLLINTMSASSTTLLKTTGQGTLHPTAVRYNPEQLRMSYGRVDRRSQFWGPKTHE